MATSAVRTQLVAYRHISQATAALCEELRREAGRCWNELVALHVASRNGTWLSERELKALSKGGRFQLHSQSIQALAEKLIANVDTARALRDKEQATGGKVKSHYPYRPKPYQTLTWKAQAIRIVDGRIHLPNGRGQPALILPLPEPFREADIRQVELLWRADHYELAITIADVPLPTLRDEGQVAGIDLGEVNIAAVCTEDGHALVINGRLLRHFKQLRNKRHQAYRSRMDRCRKGSRRWHRLKRQMSRASAKLDRQQRNVLHQASRKVITFAQQHEVRELAIGDVRDVADGVAKGKHLNQKLSQWPHGQFRRYVEEKGRRTGMRSVLVDEAYSTRTCSRCGHRHSSAPQGRVFRCSGCGAVVHRDANGAANICSKQVDGFYGHVQVNSITHRRATAVRAPTRASVAGSKPPSIPPGIGKPPEASC